MSFQQGPETWNKTVEADMMTTLKVVPVGWLIGLVGFVVVTAIGIIREVVKNNATEHMRLWSKIDDIYRILMEIAAEQKERRG